MKQTATRDRLIEAGAELIAQHGYNATGINAVLKASGVPKGSFYHYFSSKEDFGLAVIVSFSAAYDDTLAQLLEDASVTPLERLRRYFAAGRADMLTCDHVRGCLIGNLGQELAGQSDVFRDTLDKVFQRWEHRLVTCLNDAQAVGEIATDIDTHDLASFILAGWEGAILRAKTLKSVTPMQRFEDILFSQLLKP
ncbi:TetR/AcrR family transcriptional regulator [Vreelandella rituensis]|uniref:TetR family transcriptional regulator n=1 Tax=Vreelandella rituensis TaxID=2282306 RepID=A0A368U2M8_9GAMM|nr:TetR/AcrR family transcriptional regulator [Halomonas rituensis]RCV90806.1 TetR family transcriptional regulator [Halomonas rituensis]